MYSFCSTEDFGNFYIALFSLMFFCKGQKLNILAIYKATIKFFFLANTRPNKQQYPFKNLTYDDESTAMKTITFFADSIRRHVKKLAFLRVR